LGRDAAGLAELVRRGGGAGAQRAIYELAGIDAVTRALTELTTEGPDAASSARHSAPAG
jgi:hypothetical protein